MPGPLSDLLKSKVIRRVERSVALKGWALWVTSLILFSKLGEAIATSSLDLFLPSFSLQVNDRLSGYIVLNTSWNCSPASRPVRNSLH